MDHICAECETPCTDSSRACAGSCKRIFHHECIGHAIKHCASDDTIKPPMSDSSRDKWTCGDCALRIHRCFACKSHCLGASPPPCGDHSTKPGVTV